MPPVFEAFERHVRAHLPEPGARTLLVYDHFDVQPPDPLEEWVRRPAGRPSR